MKQIFLNLGELLWNVGVPSATPYQLGNKKGEHGFSSLIFNLP